MKLICSQQELSTAISHASKAVAVRSTLPILDGILFEVKENEIKLTGYNMEMVETVTATMNRSVVLTARMFSEIVRKLPEELISFRRK